MPTAAAPQPVGAKEIYLDAIRLTERMHRQFLDVIRAELDRSKIEDINSVQCLILFNIGPNELSVGELTHRGYYLGSNVSYNVRKMVDNGYMEQERSVHDRRSFHVRLTPRGLELWRKIDQMFDAQVAALVETQKPEEIQSASALYRKLEQFWQMELKKL